MHRKCTMRNHRIIFSVVFLGTIAVWHELCTEVGAAPPIVWVVDGMERVGPDASAGSDTSIELSAARGEYEPFQIIVRGPQGGLKNVDVTADDLIGSENQIIPKRNLTLYREHYIYLSQGSSDWGGSNRPLGKGWYPEPLIPFVDPQTGDDLSGAQLDAVPFDLEVNRNQPIWVDVFVPREAQAGRYNGKFTVTSQQGNVSISLTLTVWNFELPIKSSCRATTQVWQANGKQSYIELLKHKFMPYEVGLSDERELIDAYGLAMIATGFWSGADYGNCHMSDPPAVSTVQNEAERHQDDLLLYAHYADEIWECPNLFPKALEWARRLRGGGVKPMLAMFPVPELMDDGNGNSAADIWVLIPAGYEEYKSYIQEVLAKGEEVWPSFPLVQDSFSPKWTIDFAPINFRIPGFINQRHGFTGLQYWVFDYWSNDPWNDLTRFGDSYPGDGVLVYPGEQVGIEQIVAGMRLKWIREGIEDYEYVEILKSLGREDFALSAVKEIAGSGFKDWTQSNDELYLTRKVLGEKIHQIFSATDGSIKLEAPENLRLEP